MNELIPMVYERAKGKWSFRFVRSGRILNDVYPTSSHAKRGLKMLIKACRRTDWPVRVVRKGEPIPGLKKKRGRAR